MKNLKYIGLFLWLIFLFATNTRAQYYYTSYGDSHEWYLPKYVHHAIYDNYYGFEIAHVNRYNRKGHLNYNVILHRNGYFVELTIDKHGRIYKKIKHRYYNPLLTHHCTHHCGYHKTYYHTIYSKYHKIHYGYKTTVYVNASKGYHQKQNKYYTDVYIDHKNHQQKLPQKHVHRDNKGNNKPRIIRQHKRNDDQRIERNNSRGSRIQHVNNISREGQNTSRGQTRITVAQQNELSSRNR